MNTEHEIALFCCLNLERRWNLITFFQVVVPQILDYFKENKDVVPNYLILEVLRKNKQYQEQIEKILKLSKEENRSNQKGK